MLVDLPGFSRWARPGVSSANPAFLSISATSGRNTMPFFLPVSSSKKIVVLPSSLVRSWMPTGPTLPSAAVRYPFSRSLHDGAFGDEVAAMMRIEFQQHGVVLDEGHHRAGRGGNRKTGVLRVAE